MESVGDDNQSSFASTDNNEDSQNLSHGSNSIQSDDQSEVNNDDDVQFDDPEPSLLHCKSPKDRAWLNPAIEKLIEDNKPSTSINAKEGADVDECEIAFKTVFPVASNWQNKY